MSGANRNVRVVRLATVLVVTRPLPHGSVVRLSLDADVTIWVPEGGRYFVIVDKRYLEEAWSPERETAVLEHLWKQMFDRGAVDSPIPPPTVEGDPQLMLV
jgi:hypothetical protein